MGEYLKYLMGEYLKYPATRTLHMATATHTSHTHWPHTPATHTGHTHPPHAPATTPSHMHPWCPHQVGKSSEHMRRKVAVEEPSLRLTGQMSLQAARWLLNRIRGSAFPKPHGRVLPRCSPADSPACGTTAVPAQRLHGDRVSLVTPHLPGRLPWSFQPEYLPAPPPRPVSTHHSICTFISSF